MTTITTIQGTDVISTSRTDINTNFSNLNTDKIETSTLDTDTTLAANSDSKIATQKATKAYVDATASPTGKSWNNYAADAGSTDSYAISITGYSAYTTGDTFKFKANTANTGACTLNVSTLGAKTIKKDVSSDLATGDILANQDVEVIYDGTNMQMTSQRSGLAEDTDVTALTNAKQYTAGTLDNALVKNYFNIQLPFILWTGSTSGALTTDFPNWIRSSTDVQVKATGASLLFTGTAADQIYTNSSPLVANTTTNLHLNMTNIVIIDFWAILSATGTGDINMGFMGGSSFDSAYNDSGADKVAFSQSAAGTLYATISKTGVGITNTDISSGVTVTNWNNYRIEYDLSNNALFYVNGVLKATLSGTNLPSSSADVYIGFGRSNTSLFAVTAPNLSLQMNP